MQKRTICQTILMMTLALGSTAWGARMPQTINNDRDLKSALKSAKTPQDHQLIAAYCKAKADGLDAQAAGYESAAESYRNGPVVKNITAPNTAARYDSLAKGLRSEAQSNRQLAALHEQMARDAAQPIK